MMLDVRIGNNVWITKYIFFDGEFRIGKVQVTQITSKGEFEFACEEYLFSRDEILGYV